MFVLKGVGKRYVNGSNEKWALKDVDLILPEKGLVAIKGQSGSGKSTLLNLLSLLETPTKGKIFYRGRDLSFFSLRNKEDFRAYECSFIYQHFNLYESLSSEENISLALEVRGESRSASLKKSRELLKSYSMSHLAKKRAAILSGGEKQRIAILRALITEPAFLLCDEPTGALDKENEILVMNSLKEISKTRLVIIVSHNTRIIGEYADYIIELSEGRIVSSPIIDENGALVMKKHRRGRCPFFFNLLKKNFRRDFLKQLLSIISGSVGFCAILLSFGFFSGSQGIMEQEAKKSLLYTQGTLSETVYYEIEGSPLSLSQSARPLLNEAKDLFSQARYEIKNDYSYFFPGYTAYKLNGQKEKSVYFSPLNDMTLSDRTSSFKYEGSLPEEEDFSACLVNEEFASSFEESPLGKEIAISREVEVEIGETVESVLFSAAFTIVAIVEEFSFLNSPRVYYSHYGLEQYLKTLQFPLISSDLGREMTAYKVVDEAEKDSPYGNYSYLLYAYNEKEVDKINLASKSLGDGAFSFYSEAILIGESFSSLTSAFSQSLIPFLILSMASFAFILGAITLSSFIEKKKEAAILMALGARKGEVTSLYESEAVASSLFSAILAVVLSFPCTFFFNLYLFEKIGIPSLIQIPYESYFGVPLFPILGIVLLAILLGYFASSIPLFFARRLPLAEELRDE